MSETRKKSSKLSAGVLLYRISKGELEVLLGHPGGPFYSRKNEGVWTIPKGALEPGENEREAALREFEEETGFRPDGALEDLGRIKQRGGKTVVCFALPFEGSDEWVQSRFSSAMFSIEWPPKSGKTAEFPELDRVSFFTLPAARTVILPSQGELLERLQGRLSGQPVR